jgi:outer membrane protein
MFNIQFNKIITSTSALVLLIATPVFASEIKLGFIDMQKAIQETAAGKKAKKELEAEYNAKKKDLEKQEADIKKMGEDLEKKSLVMAEDVRLKKQQEIQQQMRKYQELAGKSQMELQKREQENVQPIIKKLRAIIEDIAKKEDFTAILEKSEQSVMWAKKEIDLTDRVIKEADKK